MGKDGTLAMSDSNKQSMPRGGTWYSVHWSSPDGALKIS